MKGFEAEKEAFESQKQQFKNFADKNNESFKHKFQELGESEEKMAFKENELIQKIRENELKEQEINLK